MDYLLKEISSKYRATELDFSDLFLEIARLISEMTKARSIFRTCLSWHRCNRKATSTECCSVIKFLTRSLTKAFK